MSIGVDLSNGDRRVKRFDIGVAQRVRMVFAQRVLWFSRPIGRAWFVFGVPFSKSTAKAAAIVAAVALAACLIGITNDFANDDLHLIAENVRIQDLNNWRGWFTHAFWPPPYSPDLYRPLTSALLALEYVLGAGTPVAYRLVSYLVYAGASVGVFLFARRIMATEFALAAAVLFAAYRAHGSGSARGGAERAGHRSDRARNVRAVSRRTAR